MHPCIRWYVVASSYIFYPRRCTPCGWTPHTHLRPVARQRRATGDKSAKHKKKKKSVACGGADETLAVYYLSSDARALQLLLCTIWWCGSSSRPRVTLTQCLSMQRRHKSDRSDIFIKLARCVLFMRMY